MTSAVTMSVLEVIGRLPQFLGKLLSNQQDKSSDNKHHSAGGKHPNNAFHFIRNRNKKNVPSASLSAMDKLNTELLVEHIFPFVGPDQYRYVAGVNSTFRTAYSMTFPNKTTKVETIECAKFFLKEMEDSGLDMYQIDFEIKPLILSFAAKHGNVEIVRLFNENKRQVKLEESRVTAEAALNGDLEMLKQLHINGCYWNEYTCSNAALKGHLHILTYAHENGCVWNGYTCSNAAKNGHLEVLQYARKHGCPWTAHTLKEAQDNGHTTIVTWARANGCPEWKNYRLRRYRDFDDDDDFLDRLRDDDDDDDDYRFFRRLRFEYDNDNFFAYDYD